MRKSSFGLALWLDAVERVLLALLFGFLTWSIVGEFYRNGRPTDLLLVLSEGSALAFVLLRRRTEDVSRRPADWLLALVGTAGPLLARPADAVALAPPVAVFLLMLVGFVVQISAKLTLRRSFGIVAANRGVKVRGPYRLVRHPMYAGYMMTHVGFMLAHPTGWNLAVYVTAFAFQIGRILAEERLLSQDVAYRNFSLVVPYRLIPRVF